MEKTQQLSYSVPNSKTEDSEKLCEPILLPNGTIRIQFRKSIFVDITTDKAIRVVNKIDGIAMSVSNDCSQSAFIHPNGRFYQFGSCADIVTFRKKNNFDNIMYAKMWEDRISFTQKDFPFALMLDKSGTKIKQDTFSDLYNDSSLDVFYSNSRHGPNYMNNAAVMIKTFSFDISPEKIFVSESSCNFRMVQGENGALKITWNHAKCTLRTGSRTAALTTPSVHCTASLGETSHFFVRNAEKRMHFDGSRFCVRYAGHSAGFDENDLLYIY